jgi:hypothetical protein
MTSTAAAFDGSEGAKPPSSPTLVEAPRSCSTDLSAAYTSAAHRTAS